MRANFLIVMGVAGCGKSTTGERLAAKLGWPFLEGDSLHPAENIEKMTHGIPLVDADRQPWLQAIARQISEWRIGGMNGVVTCSALRKSYRDIIAEGCPDVGFIYLRAEPALIAKRFTERRGHFMPASLIASQFEILEEPEPEENALSLDVSQPVSMLVEVVERTLEDRQGENFLPK